MLVLTYRGEVAIKEHKTMFDAALTRDIPTAKKALETHIRLGLEHTVAALEDLPR